MNYDERLRPVGVHNTTTYRAPSALAPPVVRGARFQVARVDPGGALGDVTVVIVRTLIVRSEAIDGAGASTSVT